MGDDEDRLVDTSEYLDRNCGKVDGDDAGHDDLLDKVGGKKDDVEDGDIGQKHGKCCTGTTCVPSSVCEAGYGRRGGVLICCLP